MTPEPMPLDMNTTAKLDEALPWACTPIPAAVASFSIVTGSPVPAPTSSAGG